MKRPLTCVDCAHFTRTASDNPAALVHGYCMAPLPEWAVRYNDAAQDNDVLRVAHFAGNCAAFAERDAEGDE